MNSFFRKLMKCLELSMNSNKINILNNNQLNKLCNTKMR